MNPKAVITLVLVVSVLVMLLAPYAKAQPIPREPELADQIDTLFDRASTPANQQKFLSILVFVIFGGGASYCVMRGIKKAVSIY